MWSSDGKFISRGCHESYFETKEMGQNQSLPINSLTQLVNRFIIEFVFFVA